MSEPFKLDKPHMTGSLSAFETDLRLVTYFESLKYEDEWDESREGLLRISGHVADETAGVECNCFVRKCIKV